MTGISGCSGGRDFRSKAMKSNIIIAGVFVLLVFSLVSFGDEPAEQEETTNWRSVAGIIIQIVLFLVFLAAIYYVFIYPETPERGKVPGDSGKDASEKEAQEEDAEETRKDTPAKEQEADKKDTAGGSHEEGDGTAEDPGQGE